MKPTIFALILATTPASAITAEQIESLVVRSPTPTAAEFVGVEVVGDEVMAVSKDCEVFVSVDQGVTWSLKSTISDSGTITLNPASIATDGTRTVVVSGGPFAFSDDLTTWQIGSMSPNSATDIAYGNGRFVGGNTGGSITWSTDGTDWTAASSIPEGFSGIRSIAFGNGVFAAAGNDGIIVSTDGDSWETKVPDVNTFRMSFANGRFLASRSSGLTYSSMDGVTWVEDAFDFPSNVGAISDMVFDGTRYVFCSFSGTAFTSTNLVTFTTERLPTGYDGNELVALPNGTTIACGEAGALCTNDGTGWTPRSGRIGNSFSGVAYNAGLFVTADRTSGKIFTSATGTSWEESYDTGTRIAAGPVYTGSQFVVLAGRDLTLTSPDGKNWSETEQDYSVSFQGMRQVNGNLFAWDFSSLYTSADALTWTEIDLGSSFAVKGVAFGAGRYVVTGNSDQLFSSADLTTWIAHPSGGATSAQFKGVEFIGGSFTAIESLNKGASTSADGIAWSYGAIDSFITFESTLNDPDLGLLLIGERGRITSIPDPSDLGTRKTISYAASIAATGIASGGGNTVLVGGPGLIMSTPSPFDPADSELRITLNPSGSSTLTWIQPTGTTAVVETSPDLENWLPENSPIQFSPTTSGRENASVTFPSSSLPAYYRIRR